MLTKLALQNFKAWEKCAIDLGRITVLIGPNGSGKSSLLQALGLLKQSRNQEAPVWNGPYESLGRFEDVVSRWGDRKAIRVEMSFTTDTPKNLPNASASLECAYSCTLESYGTIEHKAEYHIGDSGSIVTSYSFQTGRGVIDIWPNDLFQPIQMNAGRLIAIPISVQAPPGEWILYQAGRDLGSVVLNHLSNIYAVRTHRSIDAASYPMKPGGVDFTSPVDVANFITYDDKACWALSDWLSKIVGEDIKLFSRLLPDYQVALELHRWREYSSIAQEGAGMHNIIWPLAQIAAAPTGSLIALEEPEVHLHPKSQAQVGQVLTDIALTENKQILITTQSEHILMSFLTEAVKSGASPDDFRVYYCTSHNRVAEIEELRLDPNGGLDGGLKGFFEAGFDETQRYLEALTARNSG